MKKIYIINDSHFSVIIMYWTVYDYPFKKSFHLVYTQTSRTEASTAEMLALEACNTCHELFHANPLRCAIGMTRKPQTIIYIYICKYLYVYFLNIYIYILKVYTDF